MDSIKKVIVIGLDCAEPTLILDRWRKDLPTIDRLMQGGMYGNLTSSMPPKAVWAAIA